MSAVPQHRNLPLLLLRAREGVMSQFRAILNLHGLTEQQWRILRALLENSAMEPRQICEVCQLLSPSVTGVLARMEELGLVKRERMESDQRRVLVTITPKSRALAKKMAPLIDAQYRELEAALGPELLAETYVLLDRLLARLAAGPLPELAARGRAGRTGVGRAGANRRH
jgi:homoprotocatechuate degradation regulator HpaR